MVKPMGNVPLYSGLIRLNLIMKGKVGHDGTYFIENATTFLNIKSPGADIESPCRAIFASGVKHSSLINCPVG